MSKSILSAPHFHNEEAAFAFVESRVWQHGPVCPKCGVIGQHYRLKGKTTRIGLWKCKDCRSPFTVRMGTIFESSHVALRLWLQAIFLVASSKKGISANQLHRTLGVTLKTAWFMGHRIREAMKDSSADLFGVGGGIVESDETFIGWDKEKKPKGVKRGRGAAHKFKVLSLVDRTTGRSRSIVIDDMRMNTIVPILEANIAREAKVMTDEAGHYAKLYHSFAKHGFTKHQLGNYVLRSDPTVHTNTVEGFFSIFKRGMKGVYQHCSHNHLNRYLAEFDFRYSNRKALGIEDAERADKLLAGVVGKRLTYATSAE